MNANPEGNIVLARKKLSEAIRELIDPQARTILLDNGHTRSTWIPSRYQHLQDSLGGQQVEAKSGGEARLPIWADCADQLHEIDNTVAGWVKTRTSGTPGKLARIENHGWRPQDTNLITDWTNQLNNWIHRIDQLLNPEPTKEVLAPCPNCNRRWVYKTHAGEQVKQSALQIVSHIGCRCLACDTAWPPSRYLFLCRVLGFELPEGITAEDE